MNVERPTIMGVLNVTPDSFSDGGKYVDVDEAIAHAHRMIADGATIIDVGGESTRPGAAVVSAEEEIKRVVPVIERLVAATDATVSIDSHKVDVVRAALDAGAHVVNDIGGLRDEGMLELVAERNVPVIIMHMQGTPQNMQDNPQYTDVVTDVLNFFTERIAAARQAGVTDILIDPGIGFGKNLEHNLALLNNLKTFKSLGCPIVLGTSRKSFIEKITGAGVDVRLGGSIASNVIGLMQGVDVFRVHDVFEVKQALDVCKAIQNG